MSIWVRQTVSASGFGHFCFPAEGACAEHGGVGFLEFGGDDFHFALESVEHILFHRLADWTHEEFSRFSETAEEDDCFGRGEYGEIGKRFAEYVAGVFKDFVCEFVAVHGSIVNVFRGNLLDGEVAERGGLGAYFEEFAGGAGHSGG